jgi:hypothetical protein
MKINKDDVFTIIHDVVKILAFASLVMTVVTKTRVLLGIDKKG